MHISLPEKLQNKKICAVKFDDAIDGVTEKGMFMWKMECLHFCNCGQKSFPHILFFFSI